MIWAKKRFKVLERDNFRCQYCGKNGKDVSLEVDHIIPKAEGWTDDFNNLITCCRECNIWKWKEIIWVNNWTAKIKISDHENEMIKRFFRVWNSGWLWTIDRHNLTFLSGYLKFYYWNYLTWFVKNEWVDFNEFNKWEELCENILKKFDYFIWYNDIEDIINRVVEDEEWTTENKMERLNYLISERCTWCSFPKSFVLKYALFPNAIKEWEEEIERIRNH